MEFYRGLGIQGSELQYLIELVEDKTLNVPAASGIPQAGCIPDSARCAPDGSSTIPGFRSIMIRAINSAVAQVENRIKLALYPRRKTNFAQNPKEVYEERAKFSSGSLDSFFVPSYKEYPTWTDLDSEQQAMYSNNPNLYTNGTLPWDLLKPDQQEDFAGKVIYVPEKVEDEEKIDGRERSYIKFYERQIIKIHRLALVIQDPMGLGVPYLHRAFDPSEYMIYKKEGAIRLFPAQAKISAASNGSLMSYAGYGMRVPAFSQIIHVDYTFGLEKIPPALQEAVSLLAAARVFEMLNVSFTKGFSSFGVSGFNAAFGEGMYTALCKSYREQAEELLAAYFLPIMTSW